MRKVKLVLDELSVESFQTCAAHGRGTVLGRMPDVIIDPNMVNAGGGYLGADTYPECPSPLCQDTPLASCDGSCQRGCVPNDTVVTG